MHIIAEGHRGYRAAYPENTLVSFAAAIDEGVDAVEFDIWMTKDGVPVLMHDGNCSRTCGVDRHLRDMTLAEVRTLDAGLFMGEPFRGTPVPTFEELLQLVKEKRPSLLLGVEIKEYTEETVDKAVALLNRYGFFKQCWFYAFNGRTLRYLKERYGARTMGYPDFQMKEFDGYDAYDEIGISMAIAHSEVFPIFREKGLPMHLYCADTPEEVRFAIAQGASVITANEIKPLLEIRKG
jgi:glycerophosphoryl diester phosphodiesterase